MEDIARTILYVLDDRDWIKKVVVGAAFTFLSFFLVGIPFVLGYLLEVQRRIVRGVQPVLPEWDDLQAKFMDGLKLFVIAIVFLACFGIFAAIFGGIPFLGWLLAGVLALALSMAFLNVMVRFALTGDPREAVNVPKIYDAVKANFVDYLLASFLWLVYTAVAQLGVLACGVGVFFTLFWAWLAVSYLASKVYISAERAEAPPPVEQEGL
jgi:hypothetical protein